MKNLVLWVALMVTFLTAPAFAQMEVKQINVNQDNGWKKTVVQVKLYNPTSEHAHPGNVELMIRESIEASSWRTLKVWGVYDTMDPGTWLTL